MGAVEEILVVTVTFSYVWSAIRGKTWVHEGKLGPNFLLGKGKNKRGGLPLSFPLSGKPETISYLNWPRKGCPVKPGFTSFTENISTT